MVTCTYFLRLNYKICGDPSADLPNFKQLLFHTRVGFPAARVAEIEPGSFVFGLSGCHVELGARAMLCDLRHLADPPIATAHGRPAFERKA